ncbi:MAG: sulfatase-like hydrolase/transferase [Candidatus Brocadiia bacterium]
MNKPNIILFFTDQHRLSALGCYGETPCQTPNIDRLAEEGVRFETAYTSCPVCTPARASVMTGLHIHAHGMISNTRNLGTCISELPDGPHLLSRRLGEAGYRCGYTGKWHLGTDQPTWYGAEVDNALPSNRGFEGQDFPGHGNGGFRFAAYRDYLKERGLSHEVERTHPVLPCGTLQGPVESTVPYFLAEHTIGMIDRFTEAGAPFFIWHNNWGPHAPYFAPESYVERYRDVEIPPWPNYEWPAAEINRPHRVKLHPDADEYTWDDWATAIRHYYAFTTLIDEQIGRVVDHLREVGQADNTVVIFTSDHGETLGSHGGLADKGWHHFEEIQRIGMLVNSPRGWGEGGRPNGSVAEEWASLLDVYPTVLDLAGADYDAEDIHGASLVPLLRGETDDWRDEVFVEFCGVNSLATTMVTCRRGDLKYGWNCSNLDELYDLSHDPYETTNLVDDPGYAEALRELRERTYRFMQETNHPSQGMFRRTRLGTW